MCPRGPKFVALAQAAAAALLLAAALGAVAGNREAGQPPERCYSSPIPAGQASFGYTVSASPNATTFTFAVCRRPAARGLWKWSGMPRACWLCCQMPGYM